MAESLLIRILPGSSMDTHEKDTFISTYEWAKERDDLLKRLENKARVYEPQRFDSR